MKSLLCSTFGNSATVYANEGNDDDDGCWSAAIMKAEMP